MSKRFFILSLEGILLRRQIMITRIIKIIGITVLMHTLFACTQVSNKQDTFGNITFQNSGASDAQAAFLKGVKSLHSFEFDTARIAFQEAQNIDPSFAMAYWGEAMSENHPLWAQQDRERASIVLNSLAPSLEDRLSKVSTEKEKEYLKAIEALYSSEGDKLRRDFAYSDAMAKMYQRWPDDHEINIFYALSLLGTIRPGDDGYKRQALAGSISQKVFKDNENHPGAAHFIIHSFDDPDHAILAFSAAKVYADIAPASSHALHMPSHIFVQLGMWDRVVNSNIESYAAAVATIEKVGGAAGREDFHALEWLEYGNLMLGNIENARDNLSTALATVEKNKESKRVYNGYLRMKARYLIETGEWEDLDLMDVDTPEGSNLNWVNAVGMSAAYRGDNEIVEAVLSRLKDFENKALSSGATYNAIRISIIAKQVAAIAKLVAGDIETAVALAEQATVTELEKMQTPSGPPIPIKPSPELYGEILMAADRPAEAVLAFEKSLSWVPERIPSLLGLVRSASLSGKALKAEEMIAKIKNTPGMNLEEPLFNTTETMD